VKLTSVPKGKIRMVKINQAYLNSITPIDFDGDGTIEIQSLKLMSFEHPEQDIPSSGKLLLVLIEPRILQTLTQGPSTQEVIERLIQLKEDLTLEGYYTRFIEAQVYNGQKHQDGCTVLAIRKFFQLILNLFPNFQGAILIGSFPEAMLIRRVIWKRPNKTLIVNGKTYKNVDYLRIAPDEFGDRSEIVLEDLNGNWEKLYEKVPKAVDCIEAIPDASLGNNWPVDGAIFTSTIFNKKTWTCQDFFFIQDDNYSIIEDLPNKLSLRLWLKLRNVELNQADKNLPNPIARPDIFVSRINSRHVAVNPDPNYKDVNGNGFLAADGKPQEIISEVNSKPPYQWVVDYERDPILERKFLLDYLDRNHAFRTGKLSSISFRTAAISYEVGSASGTNNELKKASNKFGESISFEYGNLLDYVNFLKTSAILKAIMAHSGPYDTTFGFNYSIALRAANGQYVCAEGGGGQEVVANRDNIASWETFEIIDLGNSKVALRAANGQYVCAEGGGGQEVVANRDNIASWETFELINRGSTKIDIQKGLGKNIATDLENTLSKRPWHWKQLGTSNKYIPSLEDYAYGKFHKKANANLYIHRTIFENNIFSNSSSSFYIHGGCQANSPANWGKVPYNHKIYGNFQNIEGILFCCKGLAVVARAKIFWDFPEGFSARFGLTSTSRFGDGLSGYYDKESQDTNLGTFKEAIQNKKAYLWSIIGDWTLRLRYSKKEPYKPIKNELVAEIYTALFDRNI
jgi:hypothetical protein